MDTDTAARALAWAEGLEHFAEHFCLSRTGNPIPSRLAARLPGDREDVKALLDALPDLEPTWATVLRCCAEIDAACAIADEVVARGKLRDLGCYVMDLAGSLRRSAEQRKPRKHRHKQGELNNLVQRFLEKNPHASSGELAKALQRAESTIRETEAWRNRQATRLPDGFVDADGHVEGIDPGPP